MCMAHFFIVFCAYGDDACNNSFFSSPKIEMEPTPHSSHAQNIYHEFKRRKGERENKLQIKEARFSKDIPQKLTTSQQK